MKKSSLYLGAALAVLLFGNWCLWQNPLSPVGGRALPAVAGQGVATAPVASGVAGPKAVAVAAVSAVEPKGEKESAARMHQHAEEAPSWTVGFGQEFWRRPAAKVNAVTPAAKVPANIDLGDAIERVSHAWRLQGGATSPAVHARSYSAQMDEAGLHFVPRAPQREDLAALPSPEPEATFQTISIRQGQQTLYAAETAAPRRSCLGNTAQALLDGNSGLVEHYEARSGGIAVTWVLPKPLVGKESVLIEAQLAGLDYGGQSERGHHFADELGTARLRVGNVTVVDSQGSRWDVAMQFADNRLRVEVPASILAQAHYPLAIDPEISPEFGLDEPIPCIWHETATPAAAFNGSEYFVVWLFSENQEYHSILGTRITSAGMVRDLGGVPISPLEGYDRSPAVAWNGSHYFVVWADTSDGIRGTRVSRDAQLLDSASLLISPAEYYGLIDHPAVAANGADFLVAWEVLRGWYQDETQIYMARVRRCEKIGLALN